MADLAAVRLAVTPGRGSEVRSSVDFLKSMAGRDVQGTVVRAAPPGGVALIRIGGHLFSAKVEAGVLGQDARVFFQVERTGQHAFRLFLRPGLPATAMELPPHVLQLLQRLVPSGDPRRKVTDRTQALEQLQRVLENLGPTDGTERVEAMLWDETERGARSDSAGQPLPGDGDGDVDAGTHDEASPDRPKEHRSGVMLYEPETGALTLRLDFPETGVLNIAIVPYAEEGHSVFVRCERPETARLIRAESALWRDELSGAGLRLREFLILDPPHGPRVEFRA